MKDATLERLAIACLAPINRWEFHTEQRNQALDRVKDAIRAAYRLGVTDGRASAANRVERQESEGSR